MMVEGYERVMPPLRSDFERVKFGETVLELEEVLHIQRAGIYCLKIGRKFFVTMYIGT